MGKKEPAEPCPNCFEVAGLNIFMRRAYHRIDRTWQPLGWFCPNCFHFQPELVLVEARDYSRQAIEVFMGQLDGKNVRPVSITNEPLTTEQTERIMKRHKQEMTKIQMLLQRVYHKP